MIRNPVAVVLLFALITLCQPCPADADQPAGKQQAGKLQTQVRVELDYLLYLPQGYENDKQSSWPLMLFLHGAGERGDNLELVKTHGPPGLIADGKEFPFIVVSPQCPANKWWESTELLALLDEIQSKYRVDVDRVYLTGLSMGGYGTWALAAHAPDRFAAIAPICGGGIKLLTTNYAHVPVWAFHGTKDGVVPINRSEEMINALKQNGVEPKFTVYPEAGHNSWTETYDNPQLYEWLLAQNRKDHKQHNKE